MGNYHMYNMLRTYQKLKVVEGRTQYYLNISIRLCKKQIIKCFFLLPFALFCIFYGAFMLFSTFPSSINPNSTATRNGHVVGNMVKYVHNDIKYISLEELGIDPSEVSENELIIMAFDSKDKLIRAWPRETTRNREYISGVIIFMGVIIFPVIIGIVRNSSGGEFIPVEINKRTFYFVHLNGQIHLCPVTTEMLSDNAYVLKEVYKIKTYSESITKVIGKVFMPDKDKEKLLKFWISIEDTEDLKMMFNWNK